MLIAIPVYKMKHCSLLFALILLALLGSAVQSYGQGTFLDNFNTTLYSNNNGTANFATNWVESNETTDPTNGRILINSNQLRFQNLDDRFITRTLDLSAATSAILTLDFQRTNGNESILVQLFDGSSFNTIATLAGNGSVNYTLAAAEMSGTSAIRFITGSGNWGNSETIFIDNVQFVTTSTPFISIDDVSVNENAGTATFTATHLGLPTGGPFTVNYQTVDGTATAGNDYTAIAGGILSFNGTVGDTETIVVSITDDTLFESAETYTIQLTGTSDISVNITDTGTGTINDNEVVFGNTPLTLFREFDGYMDYTSTAGTLRTQPNTVDPCSITTSSSNTLSSPIPAGATIDAAYLYWSHSGATMDSQVTFEGTTIDAQVAYTSSIIGLTFYGMFSDVTSLVTTIPNPSANVYDFSGLTIDNTGSYCGSSVVLGGWSLMIFYTDTSLPASTINLYQGFDGNQNSSSTFSLSGFYAIGSVGSKTTALSWEGDQTLANNESLQFTTPLSGTNLLTGDGDNDGISANNPFNSTHFDNTVLPNLNNTASHGVDLDTYDVSAFILPGETSATTQVNVGQDYVIMNAVVLKVPSNLITGRVFEDMNYGGGAGRNYASASGIGLPGVTVELYDSVGTLVDTQTTDVSGSYVFAGMVNGTYSIRVVNGSVRSSRPGGSACTSCIPVQTFKTEYIASVLVERANEVGGANPSAADTGAGVFAGAQTLASVTIVNEGVAGLDFGFNFNAIVNTNEDSQGSLEQFIVNSNELGETGLDIEANGIFDPAAGEDTSVFMIPPTGDALGRTADTNFVSGYFDILISNGSPLTNITGNNTKIDGRAQTAYSGNTNSGTIGSGGNAVGTSATLLPNFDLPEIQLHRNNGDVIITEGSSVGIRNISVYAGNNSGIRVDNGSPTISNNLLGVNALGSNSGNINYGVEITSGTTVVEGNYIATNTDSGILIDGGSSSTIQNNHITTNGNGPCDDNITIVGGTGIVIQQNLIENASGLGIDGDGISGNVSILENTITGSGQDGGTCSGNLENVGILLDGNNSAITNNIIFFNGGPGIVLAGGNTSGNLISQNSIYANGTATDALGIDLDDSDNTGDGVTLNENGDADNGPNGLLNFPIITSAYMSGTNLVIKGWARPGATVEVFLTDVNEGTAAAGDNELGFSTDYGEGQVYLGTAVEGSGADLDSGSSSYTDVDGNTDNTNRFHFNIAIPPMASIGDFITDTATLSNSTSEFSPMSLLKVQTIITNRRITYRVNRN
ncbi:MAG: right-handed parallel beta-helix repeat-containing protein [Eudoraea sp.]|uniref:beta strand repeat-containing protein n=2 Tax=Eudoraea sp. TaxID=1979955 RepID=UPI003C7133D9